MELNELLSVAQKARGSEDGIDFETAAERHMEYAAKRLIEINAQGGDDRILDDNWNPKIPLSPSWGEAVRRQRAEMATELKTLRRKAYWRLSERKEDYDAQNERGNTPGYLPMWLSNTLNKLEAEFGDEEYQPNARMG